ncbi:hypothetical protein EVAR_14293_1 [Eumeta japonica]|uniref:Uncharacterized protein n=1 Tax=Eumeta variegata TaxID=151549 RepID=A0A4C1UNA9_EUMVA|nr:hypothetical protein EVAR_14293_1 [Eumeta japonica]
MQRIGLLKGERASGLPEISLIGRKETAEAATSRPYYGIELVESAHFFVLQSNRSQHGSTRRGHSAETIDFHLIRFLPLSCFTDIHQYFHRGYLYFFGRYAVVRGPLHAFLPKGRCRRRTTLSSSGGLGLKSLLNDPWLSRRPVTLLWSRPPIPVRLMLPIAAAKSEVHGAFLGYTAYTRRACYHCPLPTTPRSVTPSLPVRRMSVILLVAASPVPPVALICR